MSQYLRIHRRISVRGKQLAGLVLLLFGLFLSSPPVFAAELGWAQLSERERTILKPFQQRWGKYSAGTRKTMLAWARLSPGKRTKIKKRHAQWGALSATSKAKVISKLNRYKRMPKWKRDKLKAWRKWVKSLPKAEQKKLHKRLPGMGTKQRKEYIQQLEKKYGKP